MPYLQRCQLAFQVGRVSQRRLGGRARREEGAFLARLGLVETSGIVQVFRVLLHKLVGRFWQASIAQVTVLNLKQPGTYDADSSFWLQ